MSIDTVDTKKKMLQALEASLGIVSTAAAMVGISRQCHYLWMANDSEYKATVDALDDLVLDLSETALHTKIKEGDTASIIFHLKTKGKKRGYIERSQVETKAVESFDEYTDEQLDAAIAELEGDG